MTVAWRRQKAGLLASLAIAGGTLAVAALPAVAQQSGAYLSAEQPGIGRVEARIHKYDQALGVVTRLVRSPEAETECDGTCFFPSSSRSVSWRCAPKNSCELHCDVNPPVGGCR